MSDTKRNILLVLFIVVFISVAALSGIMSFYIKTMPTNRQTTEYRMGILGKTLDIYYIEKGCYPDVAGKTPDERLENMRTRVLFCNPARDFLRDNLKSLRDSKDQGCKLFEGWGNSFDYNCHKMEVKDFYVCDGLKVRPYLESAGPDGSFFSTRDNISSEK